MNGKAARNGGRYRERRANCGPVEGPLADVPSLDRRGNSPHRSTDGGSCCGDLGYCDDCCKDGKEEMSARVNNM